MNGSDSPRLEKKSVRSVDAGNECASDGTFACRMGDALDHDGEGCGVLIFVPGQRKSPVHLIGRGGCDDQTLS